MAFENMKDLEEQIIHERAALLMYHFNTKEEQQIKNIARLTGIKDVITLKPENGGQTIRSILDGQIHENGIEGPREKAILFNGIPANKMNTFMEVLKKYRFKRPLFAVVTKESIEWELKVVIENLIEERIAFSNNKISSHMENDEV